MVGVFFTHNSPPTEPIGAAVVAIAGVWIAVAARHGVANRVPGTEQALASAGH